MTAPLPPAWPVPAATWEEATDAKGRLIDETVPRDRVFDEATFRRWRLSVGIAAHHAGPGDRLDHPQPRDCLLRQRSADRRRGPARWRWLSCSGRSSSGSEVLAVRVEEGSPGWYADPRGKTTYRFWDGEQWTDLVASNLEEVGDMNRPGRAMPSAHWKPVTPPPPKKDWFDQLLPWLVADEKTGHTPLGIALWLIAWVALTIFLCSGGC